MSARIKAAISDGLQGHPAVLSAWGFGSFFRGERHNDIDVIVVLAVTQDRLLDTARQVRAALMNIEHIIGIPIDALILTESEFESRPLRQMGELVRLSATN